MWVIVTHTAPSMVSCATGPYRSHDRAVEAADRFRTQFGSDSGMTAQVVPLDDMGEHISDAENGNPWD